MTLIARLRVKSFSQRPMLPGSLRCHIALPPYFEDKNSFRIFMFCIKGDVSETESKLELGFIPGDIYAQLTGNCRVWAMGMYIIDMNTTASISFPAHFKNWNEKKFIPIHHACIGSSSEMQHYSVRMNAIEEVTSHILMFVRREYFLLAATTIPYKLSNWWWYCSWKGCLR